MSALSWMAWTWPTAAFFVFILALLILMSIWEVVSPGGGPRKGILRLDTTRGDRLFISLLGSAYIHLAWLGFSSLPLTGAVVLSLVYSIFVFSLV